MKTPRTSVVMAVYNGQETLAQCLQSLAAQTDRDFEVIVVNDASADHTGEILQEWSSQFPGGFRVLTNLTNQGLTSSLIRGVLASQARYLARIDADDRWAPTKLERQIRFLEKHGAFGIIGCWYINVSPGRRRKVRLPETDQQIRASMYCQNPFAHSCVVIRRSLVLEAGNYNPQLKYGQDYDLWFRLLPRTKFKNINEFLVEREHYRGLSHRHSFAQLWQSVKTIFKYLRLYRASLYQYRCLLYALVLLLISPPKQAWQRFITPASP